MICKECGCDQTVLKDCCTSTEFEDRAAAWVITENCATCKKAMEINK